MKPKDTILVSQNIRTISEQDIKILGTVILSLQILKIRVDLCKQLSRPMSQKKFTLPVKDLNMGIKGDIF